MRSKHLLFPTLAAVLVAVIALAIRNQPPSASATSTRATTVTGGSITVPISSYKFVPVALKVKVGTHVTWKNEDPTAHTATADGGSFDTGTLQQGQSKALSFTKPGTYTYHCAFHGFMTATITVVG